MTAILEKLELPRIDNFEEIFLWADYFEIQCLLSVDGERTITALEKYLGSGKGLPVDSVLEESDDEPTAEQADDDAGDDWDGSPGFGGDISERLANRVSAILNSIYSRSQLFSNIYPFEFKIQEKTIFKKDKFTEEQLLYIFFLFAGNLRFISQKKRNVFTTDFERLGSDALTCLFPRPWEWRHLGTAPHPTLASYKGKKVNKLKTMASDIKASFAANPTEFSSSDTSDAGLDFVCWYPFDRDLASHIPLVFAQSGCTADPDEIYSKQRSVSRDRIRNLFNNICSYEFFVTPECFRNASAGWHVSHELTSVFIDRYRLIALLRDRAKEYMGMKSIKYIKDDILKAKIDV